MPFDPAFDIATIYPGAYAAYLIMNVPNPALPPGFTLVGAIEADTQHAAPAMALADPQQIRIVNTMLFESNIFGLVAWHAAEQTAMVAFRGTQTIVDWIANVDAVQIPYPLVSDIGLVHMGFALVYEHVHLNVAELLLAGCKGAQRILVTGHSLGGAVAVLSALDILANVPLGVVPELYTFAGPRTGDPDFRDHFNIRIPTCFRVVNFGDLVPQVPVPPLYEHVGTEVLVDGGFQILDVTFAHHLTTYLAGLKKMVPAPPQPLVAALKHLTMP